MAQRLAKKLGLAVGVCSGANLVNPLMVNERLGPDSSVVTVFCDDNKKYLSTDLFREEPARADYISTQLELLRCKAVHMPAG